MCRSPEYMVWASMLKRCRNENNQAFKNYGGRGISVCDAWRDFVQFYADMGPRPSPMHTLERLRNNEGYSRANCVWATRVSQANNMRTNRVVFAFGRALTIAQWSRETGIHRCTLASRLNAGWSGEKALTK
jgi:hypothetical protein